VIYFDRSTAAAIIARECVGVVVETGLVLNFPRRIVNYTGRQQQRQVDLTVHAFGRNVSTGLIFCEIQHFS
jgi:hypothetical protein